MRVTRALMPWPAPRSVYFNDGADTDVTLPAHVIELPEDHHFSVRFAFGHERALMTNRSRWLVVCTTCNVILHPATTSAFAQIRHHIDDLQREQHNRECQAAAAGVSLVAAHDRPLVPYHRPIHENSPTGHCFFCREPTRHYCDSCVEFVCSGCHEYRGEHKYRTELENLLIRDGWGHPVEAESDRALEGRPRPRDIAGPYSDT